MRLPLLSGLVGALLFPLVVLLNNLADWTALDILLRTLVMFSVFAGITIAMVVWYSPPPSWRNEGALLYLCYIAWTSLVVAGLMAVWVLAYLLITAQIKHIAIPHDYPYMAIARFLATSAGVSTMFAVVLVQMLAGDSAASHTGSTRTPTAS